MRFLLILILGAFGLAGCYSDGDCLSTSTNLVYITFKKKSSTTTDTLIYFTSIRALSAPADSALKFTTGVTSVTIPVDVSRDTTVFVFNRINTADSTQTVSDTLAVSYSMQSKVLGKQCGAYPYFTKLKTVRASQTLSYKMFNDFLLSDPSTSAYALNYQFYY